MKLELKHLVPYLPYGLKVEHEYHVAIITTMYLPAGNYNQDLWLVSMEDTEDTDLSCSVNFKEVKPILRPLNDILDTIRKEFYNLIGDIDEISELKIEYLPYGAVEWLIENHYDIFSLIDNNLAVDINTLNKQP